MRGRRSLRFAATLMSGLTAAVMGLSAASTASAAVGPQDPVPIGPNEHFRGFINNHPPGKAVIIVICPGPVNTGGMKASRPTFLSTLRVTAAGMSRRHPGVTADRDGARILRSVLMKPEARGYVTELHARVEELAAG